MKVPRAIALPIVLTICALTLLTTTYCFLISHFDSQQLEHLSNSESKPNTQGMTNPPPAKADLSAIREGNKALPGITQLYFRWFRLGFLLPVITLIAGSRLLRSSECSVTALTWFACLSVLAMVLWSLCYLLAVHLGMIAFTYNFT